MKLRSQNKATCRDQHTSDLLPDSLSCYSHSKTNAILSTYLAGLLTDLCIPCLDFIWYSMFSVVMG
ncbi:hypothetical protein CLU79DRAFT_764011 [Phycomyces nitens]|nr:hypothetical protein CLU79DRAFT_764011 [Phycomyces nitens]